MREPTHASAPYACIMHSGTATPGNRGGTIPPRSVRYRTQPGIAQMSTWDGRRQRDLRQARGMAPESLAIMVGRSAAMVLAYERGRTEPPLSVATGIAAALGVQIDDLLTEEVSDAIAA